MEGFGGVLQHAEHMIPVTGGSYSYFDESIKHTQSNRIRAHHSLTSLESRLTARNLRVLL